MSNARNENMATDEAKAKPLSDFSDLVPLRNAAKMLPGNISKETVRSWTTVGVAGHRLKVTRLGTRLYVKPADMRAFIDAIQK